MTALARPLPAATPLRWPLYWLLVLLLALPLWGADARANPLDQLGGGQQQILPAEEAFPLFLERIGEHRLLLTVDVAEGYYLYREKLAFEVRNGGVALTDVAIPEGREKDDPSSGKPPSSAAWRRCNCSSTARCPTICVWRWPTAVAPISVSVIHR